SACPDRSKPFSPAASMVGRRKNSRASRSTCSTPQTPCLPSRQASSAKLRKTWKMYVRRGGFDFGNPAYALLFSLEIPAGQYLLCGDLGACGGGKFAGIPVTPYAPVYSRSREPSPRTSFGPQIDRKSVV